MEQCFCKISLGYFSSPPGKCDGLSLTEVQIFISFFFLPVQFYHILLYICVFSLGGKYNMYITFDVVELLSALDKVLVF